jgi:sulfatase maturation enzyme AslB (radical SAM superfamily)
MRGVKCFDLVIKNYQELRKNGMKVGFNTVIAKHNINQLNELVELSRSLQPNHHTFEIAQGREELFNDDSGIYLDVGDYREISGLLNHQNKGILGFLRNRYNQRVEHILAGRKYKCYSGLASAYVDSKGDLCFCGVKKKKLGNLLEKNFKEIWYSKRADYLRQEIKKKRCTCTLANACMTNIMCDLK